MRTEKLSRIVFRLGVGLLLILSTLAATAAPVRAAPNAPDRDWKKYERNALKRILNRNAFALEIAQVCLTQATHPDLLGLCQRLNDNLPQESATLQSWLQTWYGLSYHGRLTPAQRYLIKRLARLSVQGEKFEIQSMKLYRVLFKQGIAETTKCSMHAPHAEMAAYCTQALPQHQQDFTNVTQWLCDWYDRCYGGVEPSMMDLLEEDW